MTDNSLSLMFRHHAHLQAFDVAVMRDQERISPTWILHLGDILRECNIDSSQALDALEVTAKPRTEIEENDWIRMHLGALPERLDGRTVLDIGGYDGFAAFACLQRGAKRAVVIDNLQCVGYTQTNFPFGWGRPKAYAGVEYVLGDLRDWSTWMDYVPLADLVLCYNVIYHVAAPLDLLIQLRALTRGELLLSTSYKQGDEEVWHFMPDASKTIFWTPTKPGLAKALDFVGFDAQEVAGDEHEVIYRCTPR